MRRGVTPIAVALFVAAGLAAAVAQHAHDEGLDLSTRVLNCPMVDDHVMLRGAGHRRPLVWIVGSRTFAWSAYLDRKPRFDEPPPSAASARRVDLAEDMRRRTPDHLRRHLDVR